MTTSKLRLNTDIRKKIGGLILSHFENEKTTELENYTTAKEDILLLTILHLKLHKELLVVHIQKKMLQHYKHLKRNMGMLVM